MNDRLDVAGIVGGGTHADGTLFERAAVIPGNGGPGVDVHLLLQRDQAKSSRCTEVNNARQVCGMYHLDENLGNDLTAKGFLLNLDTSELVLLADLKLGAPVGLSDSQRLIGVRSEFGGYAYDVKTSEMHLLDFTPRALSRNGEWIVGKDENFDSVLWRQGKDKMSDDTIRLKGFEGGGRPDVSDVNSFGLAVGVATPETKEGVLPLGHAVLYDAGQAWDLNELVEGTDWLLVSAAKINDDGVILAQGIRPELLEDLTIGAKRVEAVILRPLPEIDHGAYLGFEQLFGGAAVDGPGVGLIGGKLRPIPGWDPVMWRAVWDTLHSAQRDITGPVHFRLPISAEPHARLRRSAVPRDT